MSESLYVDSCNQDEAVNGQSDWQYLEKTVEKWADNQHPGESSVEFDNMVQTWGWNALICTLAKKYWYRGSKIAELLTQTNSFLTHKKLRSKGRITIAAYYRNIKNGGTQRVVANLCNIWSAMTDNAGELLYNVILITDKEMLDDEYSLNANVVREFLPEYNLYEKDKYAERLNAWNHILDKHEIDVVVTSMWHASCTLWDMLSVKSHKSSPAFIIHLHQFCAVPYGFGGDRGLELMYLYQLCDGVVTLSESDTRFVGTFCPNVKCILNPMDLMSKSPESPSYEKIKEHRNVLWLARISAEKKPLDAIYMMKYVVKKKPDAKLYIVGDGDDEILKEMHALVGNLGLDDNVVFVGFTMDVQHYYQMADVFVSTSDYEGFGLTYGEAMMNSLPIVSYDIPWITFMEDGRGIIPVKQDRPDLLAEKVLLLLEDSSHAEEMGSQGRSLIDELLQVDIGKEWKEFFLQIGDKENSEVHKDREGVLFEQISRFQQKGKDNIRNRLENDKKRAEEKWNAKLKQAYQEKSELNVKLQEAYREKSEANAKLQQTYKEKSEVNAKLLQTYQEKSEVNAKLLQTYQEKSKVNAKLLQTYQEKSEVNAKLKQTYQEKFDRGVEIKKLNGEIAQLQAALKSKEEQLDKRESEISELKEQAASEQAMIRELKEQRQEWEDNCNKLNMECSKLEEKLTKLQQDNKLMKEEKEQRDGRLLVKLDKKLFKNK